MKQLHVKSYFKGLFGGTCNSGVIDGRNSSHLSSLTNDGNIPLPIAVTVRNLSLRCPIVGHTELTYTIQKNRVDALQVVSGGGVVTPVKNLVDSVVFAPGDLIRGVLTGTAQTFGVAPSWSTSVEMEGAENVYGIAAISGTFGVGQGFIGGACGNGIYNTFPGSFSPSNTKSINALDGTITSLCAFAFSGAPGVGIWTSYIVKNGILQDGSGGTVDTSVVLTGATTFNISTFSLAVVIQDVLDIVTLRTGIVSPGANNHVSNALTLTPTIAGRFMFCGGSNSSLNRPLAYRWVESNQGEPEDSAAAIIGANGVMAHGLYIDKTLPPGVGASAIHTLRRSLTDTTLEVTITGPVTKTGSDTGNETFPEDALIDLETEVIPATADNGQLHWSVPVSVAEADSITVQKITHPTGSPQVFDFTAGGGLSPGTFALQDGDVQVFDGLSPGTYSIEETLVDGWDTSYVVSNGDDPSAITLDSGETVTVTVTNVLVECPGLVTGPRLDGLPYEPPSFEPCEGTGTRGAPRIGA